MDHPPKEFPTTRWTLVRRAVSDNDPKAGHALDALCSLYWPPIYSFIRNSGYAPEDAEDHTQGFFEKVLRLETFDAADPTKGKLRTFLLQGISNYLASYHRGDHAKKRDSRKLESFDAWKAENIHRLEPSHGADPEVLFLRQWTLTIINSAVEKVEKEFVRKNKMEVFEVIKPMLDGGPDQEHTYQEFSEKLGMTEEAFRQQVSRARKRLVKMLRAQVAATLDNPSETDIDNEVALLLQCLNETQLLP